MTIIVRLIKRIYLYKSLWVAKMLLLTHVVFAQGPGAEALDYPRLEGALMGQKPPGMVAEPFAPGIISREGWELAGVFAPGMKEFYYAIDRGIYSGPNKTGFLPMVVGFRLENNVWKKFTEFKRRGTVIFSPDGARMHMADGYRERKGDRWSERKSLGPMFDRTDWGVMRMTSSLKGTYVFDDYKSGDVLRISTMENGRRQEPTLLGPQFNSGKYTAHPFIAPDESYIIWDSKREGGYGDSDLYISFRQPNGAWGPAINMGDKVNSERWDAAASVTPDGKYLMFNRGMDEKNDNVDIYWIDAQIIETLRPLKGAYFGQQPPGLSPQVFAPGIITLDQHSESSITFSPDMTEIFFNRKGAGESHNIYTMKFIDGEWTQPALAAFSTNKAYLDLHPRFSPDGNHLYFGSTRPLPDSAQSSGFHQWYLEKAEGTWSHPKPLLPDLLQNEWVMCVNPAANGNLYFTSKERGEKLEDEGIYFAENQDGMYHATHPMSEQVNGAGKWIAHPYIAPDERYLIYDAERATGIDNGDLYVSFNQNGIWTASYDLGPEINTALGQSTATVSPDGKYLFYNSVPEGSETTDLYWVSTEVLDRVKTEQQESASSNAYVIAYSSKGTDNSEIYLTDEHGKSKLKITDHPGNDGYAAWSPDGQQIASYAYHDGRKTWSIHTMNWDGSNRKRLTHAKNKWDSAPAWSPDGQRIAFGRSYRDAEDVWREEIWIMNADGSDQHQIKDLSGGGPAFTADGQILFYSGGATPEICMADVDGSNLKALTNNLAEEYHPEVSPDGKQVVFMSNRDGNHEIYVMNMDGSDQRRLTFNEVRDSTPAWSPDGSQILFTSHKPDNEERFICIMNRDGSGLRKLIDQASTPAWRNSIP